MARPIEHYYQSIGQLAVDCVGETGPKLLVYAEAEDGVISAGIFHADRSGAIIFKFGPDALLDEIHSFWEDWRAGDERPEWRAMAYVVEDGKLRINLRYPDQIDADESPIARRTAVVRQHFGDGPVDYSRP